MPVELYIGLMSGTSLDGVDAALVEVRDGSLTCTETTYLPYPEAIRSAALALHTPGKDDLHHAKLLANGIAELYADAVSSLLSKANIAADRISAVGAHGQTIRHNPADGYTIQLVNAALLAERTGINVVSDFRSRDIAAGGQGAPLVPAFHEIMLRSEDEHRIVLNIGGIANITDLKPGRPTRGFDTGPGNMLMDAWIRHVRGDNHDADGKWAASGHTDEGLLKHLLGHSYLKLAPPKSCGREEFNLAWLHTLLQGHENPADVQATLAEFTARSVADAVHAYCGKPDALLVCGGGARNHTLMQALSAHFPETAVTHHRPSRFAGGLA